MPSISNSRRKDVAAGILCGGQSRRMGRSKASLLSSTQRTLFDLAMDRVQGEFESVVLLLADPKQASQLQLDPDWNLAFDTQLSRGPVAGIAAGLQWASERELQGLLVAPIDMPELTLSDQMHLLPTNANEQRIRIAIDAVSNQLQPLVGYYPISFADVTKRHAASKQRSMMRLLESVGHDVVEFPPERLLNLNTPDDYEAWIASE